MIAELAGQDMLADLGSVAGALLAIGALLAGSLALLRRVLRSEVRPIVEQFTSNGGSTARDALDRLEVAVAEIRQERHVERAERLKRQDAHDLEQIATQEALRDIDSKLDHHLAWHQTEVEEGPRVADTLGGQK